MATHSSVLAWRIPGTGEPGGLPSVGLHRVGHDWSDLAAAHASKVMLKILQARLQEYMNRELQDVQAGLQKAEEPEIKLPTSAGSWKKQESSTKIYFCFIDYANAIDSVDHNKMWKFFKRQEYQTTWPASWEICMQVKKQQLEADVEQQTGSK